MYIYLPSGDEFTCVIPVAGSHMVSNALAGAAVGYTLGLTPEEIKAGIENYTTIPGRNHLIQTDSLTILDDCYNANPVSTMPPWTYWPCQKAGKWQSLRYGRAG